MEFKKKILNLPEHGQCPKSSCFRHDRLDIRARCRSNYRSNWNTSQKKLDGWHNKIQRLDIHLLLMEGVQAKEVNGRQFQRLITNAALGALKDQCAGFDVVYFLANSVRFLAILLNESLVLVNAGLIGL